MAKTARGFRGANPSMLVLLLNDNMVVMSDKYYVRKLTDDTFIVNIPMFNEKTQEHEIEEYGKYGLNETGLVKFFNDLEGSLEFDNLKE